MVGTVDIYHSDHDRYIVTRTGELGEFTSCQYKSVCTASSEYSLIETIVIVVNLLASPKLCNPAVKLPPEPFQKKSGPPASSHPQSVESIILQKKREAYPKAFRLPSLSRLLTLAS